MDRNLGPKIANRLALLIDATRLRGFEPVSIHLGGYMWQQLRDWAAETGDPPFVVVTQIQVQGLPVWRHPTDHHLEIETLATDVDLFHLEACL